MKIYNCRTPNVDYDDPWKDCLFTDNAQLDSFGAKQLVSFNNQVVLLANVGFRQAEKCLAGP